MQFVSTQFTCFANGQLYDIINILSDLQRIILPLTKIKKIYLAKLRKTATI